MIDNIIGRSFFLSIYIIFFMPLHIIHKKRSMDYAICIFLTRLTGKLAGLDFETLLFALYVKVNY